MTAALWEMEVSQNNLRSFVGKIVYFIILEIYLRYYETLLRTSAHTHTLLRIFFG